MHAHFIWKIQAFVGFELWPVKGSRLREEGENEGKIVGKRVGEA